MRLDSIPWSMRMAIESSTSSETRSVSPSYTGVLAVTTDPARLRLRTGGPDRARSGCLPVRWQHAVGDVDLRRRVLWTPMAGSSGLRRWYR